MNKEELLDKLRKMLFTTQQANECGLSNNDFKEDIETLSEAIGLIEKQDKIIDKMAEKLEEKSKSMTKGKWKEFFKKEVEKC